MSFQTADYDYLLPEERIALRPAGPRDAARLLAYNRKSGTVTHTTFRDLPELLPTDTALILNDTRVIKARIFGRKSTGGKCELLLIKPLPEERFLVNIRGRVHPGSHLEFPGGLRATVRELLPDGGRIVTFALEGRSADFAAVLPIFDQNGRVPLPPYIKREDEEADATEYQTVFAKDPGSVAAPTASLHFTEALLDRIRQEHPVETVTLHVGMGTFKGVEAEDIREHAMHSEWYAIPRSTRDLLDSAVSVTAVGTTVTRTVEFYARTKRPEGECDLFLHPGNPPVRVDHLITNFHLPKSTLIMLVAAFLGREKTLELYELAIKEGYRFYSYGDGMLIL